ncbi:MAG: hydantoinase/oxoprolinase N-terminal domain-containing protein [Candidatus Binatia bacterium]
MKLIGVDVGGTFTDILYTDTATRQVLIHKVPTTSADPSVGVIAGITDLCQRYGIAPVDIQQIYHGTTIATNALLEYKGARRCSRWILFRGDSRARLWGDYHRVFAT